METKTALPQLSQPVFLQPLPVSNVKTNYKSKASKILSILQIVGGILILLFGLGSTVPLIYDMEGRMRSLLFGVVFDTILLTICGGIGIGASKKKTRCLIVGHMVLCVLASISVLCCMFQGISNVVWTADDMKYSGWDYYGDDAIEPPMDYKDYYEYPEGTEVPWGSGDEGSSPNPIPVYHDMGDYEKNDYIIDPMPQPTSCFGWFSDTTSHKISMGMGGVLILLCLMEFIVCVWGSALACKVTCCCGVNGQNQVTPGFQYGQVDPANPHVVVINGQGYALAGGPVVTPAVAAPLTKEQEAWGTQVTNGEYTAQSPPPPY